MHAVIRQYTGADALADAMIPRTAEVTALLSSIPGFKSYHAVRTGGGGVVTFTVCEDKAGTDESVKRAAEWVRANVTGVSLSPPTVSEGDVYISF